MGRGRRMGPPARRVASAGLPNERRIICIALDLLYQDSRRRGGAPPCARR